MRRMDALEPAEGKAAKVEGKVKPMSDELGISPFGETPSIALLSEAFTLLSLSTFLPSPFFLLDNRLRQCS